jgi:hypothetical protein
VLLVTDDDKIRRLHEGADSMPPARLPEPVTRWTVLHEFDRALTQNDDQLVRLAGHATSLQDPRDIAGQILALAQTQMDFVARGMPTGTVSRKIGALQVAFCLACARVDEMRIDSGDAA